MYIYLVVFAIFSTMDLNNSAISYTCVQILSSLLSEKQPEINKQEQGLSHIFGFNNQEKKHTELISIFGNPAL